LVCKRAIVFRYDFRDSSHIGATFDHGIDNLQHRTLLRAPDLFGVRTPRRRVAARVKDAKRRAQPHGANAEEASTVAAKQPSLTRASTPAKSGNHEQNLFLRLLPRLSPTPTLLRTQTLSPTPLLTPTLCTCELALDRSLVG
jgi:hypothetical protein